MTKHKITVDLKRSYKPLYSECVFIAGEQYNIDKAWDIVNLWSFKERKKKLTWVRVKRQLEYFISKHGRGKGRGPCDLSIPLLIDEERIVIDGKHRVYKAAHLGISYLPAFKIKLADIKMERSCS